MRNPFKTPKKALTASPTVLEAAQAGVLNLNVRMASTEVRNAWLQFQSAGYGYLYAHQPAVRTVVDYIATNAAQLGPKLYEHVSETEREEEGDHPAAEALRDPNPWTPGKQLIYETFAEFLVYNNAYILKIRPSAGGRLYLLSVPAPNVTILGVGITQIAGYSISRIDGSSFEVAPNEMIHWRGYNASDRRMGVSKLETLRAELSEAAATQQANVDLMESGLQQRGYIKRPLEASDWNTDGGRERFIDQFRAAMQRADRGYPVLEEGMEIAPLGVSPKDAEMLESRRLFDDEVAQQYGMVHCPPRSEEERRQFYADVLPPLCTSFCDFLRLQLLQEEFMEENYYFEFDMDEKRMSDDRLKALTSAAGAPILTRNEARAYLDKPPLDSSEGDDAPEDVLVVPMNVITGGKPSPGVMPIQDPNKPSQDGDFREGETPIPPGGQDNEDQTEERSLLNGHKEEAVAEKLVRLYHRQERALASRPGHFDIKRWNRELTNDLREVFQEADPNALEALANQINTTTKEALAGPDPQAAMANLKSEAVRWAQDIDRARVALVAASLLNAGE